MKTLSQVTVLLLTGLMLAACTHRHHHDHRRDRDRGGPSDRTNMNTHFGGEAGDRY